MVILHLLIDEGANVNAVDRDGRTALDCAFEAINSQGKFKISFFSVYTVFPKIFTILKTAMK